MIEARERQGLSQPALAERVGMSQTGIASIETGDSKRPKKLREIARALQVSEEWLLGESDSDASSATKQTTAEAELDELMSFFNSLSLEELNTIIEENTRKAPRREDIERSGEVIKQRLQFANMLFHHAPNASFPPRYQNFPEASVPLLGQTEAGTNGRFVLNGQRLRDVFAPPELAGVEGAYAVQVYGYSMEPKFEAGDTVWVNPYAPVRARDYAVVQVLGSDEGDDLSSYIKQFIRKTSKIVTLRQLNPEEGDSEIMEFPTEKVVSIHKIVFQALA